MISERLRKWGSRTLTNLRGWSTNRKIIVIESDDWGSIRMPSRTVYSKCLNAGYRVDQIPYERYDSLASEDDLELLFDLLSSFRDHKGNHPVITANTIVANPDFDKIKSTGFKEYHYEQFTQTLKNYPRHTGCFQLWKKGIEEGVFFPQYHGREHLNVSLFMNSLHLGVKEALFAFEYKMPGIIPHGDRAKGNAYVETLRYTDEQDKMQKLNSLVVGADIFDEIFQYRSESFIPPNYIWSRDFDKTMAQIDIRYFQGNRKMLEPVGDGNGSLNIVKRKLGEKNDFGQYYLIRNSLFEPSLMKNKNDAVNQCLQDIASSFMFKKPAIICSHRLNYIGYIDEGNRDENLILLKNLFEKIMKNWPDVEFMTSNQLGKVISGNV